MPGFAAFHVGIQTDDAKTAQGSNPPIADPERDSKAYIDSMSE